LAGARAAARLRSRRRARAGRRPRRRARPRRRPDGVAGEDRRVRTCRVHARVPARREHEPAGVHRVREAVFVSGAPEPEEIFEKTRREGERRLERPLLEVISTALAAGFDIAAGVILIAVLASPLEHHFGKEAASVAGALGFGVGFIFLVVGRGELFTENFLVPLAGLHGKQRNAWWKIVELWTVSPVFNIVAGAVVAIIVSTHGVLPVGSGRVLTDVA